MPRFLINRVLFNTGNNPLANCHQTAFRFRNRIPVGGQLLPQPAIIQALWPNGYVAANRILSIGLQGIAGDISTINPGDIIGFWTLVQNGQFVLQHTMIAQRANRWIGTNNLGTMAQPLYQFRNIDQIIWGGAIPGVGWFGGNGNLLWHHSADGVPPQAPLYITKG